MYCTHNIIPLSANEKNQRSSKLGADFCFHLQRPAAGWEGCRSACIEEYNETDQTATVHLEYIPDLIEPAFVEIDLKRNKVHLIFTRC